MYVHGINNTGRNGAKYITIVFEMFIMILVLFCFRLEFRLGLG